MSYLRRAINHLRDAQSNLTNAQCLGEEIDYEDCNDVDNMLDCIVSRLERYNRRNRVEDFTEKLQTTLKEE